MTENTKNTKNTKNTEKTPEKTPAPEAQTAENLDLLKHSNLERTPEFDTLVTKWFQEMGASPFENIEITDDSLGTIAIDMHDVFHSKAEELFGDELDEIVSDYVQALMKSVMTDITPEEMKAMAEEYALMAEAEETPEKTPEAVKSED